MGSEMCIRDSYELSDLVIKAGVDRAKALGIDDRIKFFNENVFESEDQDKFVEKYDLVHWDNSLHHMFDVDNAIRWSVRVLKSGGVLVVDDYMGPSYMQVAQRDRQFADSVRAALPRKYLKNPVDGSVSLKSPNIPKARFLETDPSEMADSGRIYDSLKKYCNDIEIVNGGGVLYFLGLRPLFGNFNPNNSIDIEILESLLEIDAQYTKITSALFHGFACWKKN